LEYKRQWCFRWADFDSKGPTLFSNDVAQFLKGGLVLAKRTLTVRRKEDERGLP
jgi:hypothetical protein